MSKDRTYADGVRLFKPNDNAPDWVLGTLIITPETLTEWMKANGNLATEYNGKQQIRLQILKGQNGVHCPVDTYQPDGVKVIAQAAREKAYNLRDIQNEDSDLPF